MTRVASHARNKFVTKERRRGDWASYGNKSSRQCLIKLGKCKLRVAEFVLKNNFVFFKSTHIQVITPTRVCGDDAQLQT